jgi:hypothetical protein
MSLRPRPVRIGIVLLLVALLQAAAPRAAAPPGAASNDEVKSSLHIASRWADLLRESIAVLEHSPDAATVWAALYDGRRIAAEIDRISATAVILEASERDRQLLRDMAAEAHLNLALLETHGLEFERARREISQSRMLSDHVAHPDFRTPWIALQSGRPGQALVTHYKLLTLPEFESALEALWHHVRKVPIEFNGFDTKTLLQVTLKRDDAPATGSLEGRLLEQAVIEARQKLEKGIARMDLALPPGLYRIRVGPDEKLSRRFIVPEVTTVDRVVIDRARFELKLSPKPGPHGPWLFLNGIEATDLSSMPYGVYRVKADRDEFPDAPKVVEFILGEGIPDKTRTSWTIYVPAGGTTRLRMGKR